MDPRLELLIREYQAAVASAVDALERTGIARPRSNEAWSAYDVPQRGSLVGGGTYFKHGYGCAVQTDHFRVDFDFGDAGQIDGFDLWRLWDFAESHPDRYGFASDHDLKIAFTASTVAGDIRPSAYILHYLDRERAG